MINKNYLIALGLAPLAGVASLQAQPQKSAKPNVLIIHCDQLGAWALGCYGGKEIETPNIDRLGKEGVVVTNFYANTPVSTPSRGSWQSGLYPPEHGAYKNDLQIRQDIPTFASVLRDNGYATGYAGKWHLDGNPKRPGWDIRGADMGWTDRKAMYSFGHYKTIEEKEGEEYPVFSAAISIDAAHYPTDWFATKTINFIDEHKDGPFCFMLSIPDPHVPYSVRAPYDRMYSPSKMIMPQTLLEEPKSDYYLYNESRMKSDDAKGGKDGKKKGGGEDSDNVKGNYKMLVKMLPQIKTQYFGEIKCIDDNVGRIIDYLKANNLYDNTIIVVSADHGDMMGEHARMAKGVPFDPAARIPFIVRYPARIQGGRTIDNVASCIDFYPTILDLTGVTSTAKISGHDFTPVLTGAKGAKWDDEAFFRCYASNYPWVGVVTKDYKLVYGKNDIGKKPLLIDRKKDPSESYNVYGQPGYEAITAKLSDDLLTYCQQHNDPFLEEWLQARIKVK